jgi:hypothetical protein
MSAKLPSVPSIPGNLDPQLMQVLSAMKANIEAIHSGEAALPYVTASQLNAATAPPVDIIVDPPNTTPPAALDKLEVIGGVLFNLLTWGTLPGGLDHIKVYRAAINNRTLAKVVGTTQDVIWADYIPDGVKTKYYYWLRAVSSGGILGAWNLVNGHVSTAGTSATPLGIGDKQMGTISASKIACLNLAALSANLGTVTAGRLHSGDEMFSIDLVNKNITLGSGTVKPAGYGGKWWGSRYMAMASGNITNYEWTGKAYVESKSLRVIEAGTVQNNSTVVLKKFFKTQPKIIVSPDSIQSYSSANSGQDQTLQIAPTDIKEVQAGSGIWSFKVVAQLVLANNSKTFTPNQSSGPKAVEIVNSSVQVTPNNTTALTVNVTFSSIKGTGLAPNYCYRNVSYALYARAKGATAWITVATAAGGLGATLAEVGGSLTAYWQFYVGATFSDGGGTFISGAGGYDSFDTILRLAGDTVITTVTSDGAQRTDSPTFTLPDFTPAAGYSVYNVNYNVVWGGYLNSATYASGGTAAASLSGLVNFNVSSSGAGDTDSLGDVNTPQGTIQSTGTSYSKTVGGFVTLSASGSHTDSQILLGKATAQFKVFAAGTQALVQQRKPYGNVTTPSNTLTLTNYIVTLTGAKTLANGTLNYTAIL